MSDLEPITSPYVFGIDLGTTNSSIAVYRMGGAEALRVEGKLYMPSAVYFGPDKILVGEAARDRYIIEPENTILSVKSQLGTGWTHEFQGQTYTPTDVSEKILNRLCSRLDAGIENELKGVPKRVIICVPANFDANKQEATREAAMQAGLEVLDLLAEPVAAATAYALDRSRKQVILVYDLGGGTLDVSILQVDSTDTEEAELKVLGVAGVPHLGGDDFDEKVMRLIAADFQVKTGIDLYDETSAEQEIDANNLRRARQKLKAHAERAKILLTDEISADIDIPDLVEDGGGHSHSLEMQLTRDQFEAAIQEEVEKSKTAVDEALAKAGLTIKDISRVILVGGSSRVLLVKRKLLEWYGKEPYADLDPATVVARGAAMWGAARYGSGEVDKTPVRRVRVFNKVTHYLGVETRGGDIDWLLPEGKDIPADGPLTITEQYQTTYDDQDEIEIRILQAVTEMKKSGDPGVIRIGELSVVDLPRRQAGEVIAEVTFAISQSNVLTVTATCEGKSVNVAIDRTQQ